MGTGAERKFTRPVQGGCGSKLYQDSRPWTMGQVRPAAGDRRVGRCRAGWKKMSRTERGFFVSAGLAKGRRWTQAEKESASAWILKAELRRVNMEKNAFLKKSEWRIFASRNLLRFPFIPRYGRTGEWRACLAGVQLPGNSCADAQV